MCKERNDIVCWMFVGWCRWKNDRPCSHGVFIWEHLIVERGGSWDPSQATEGPNDTCTSRCPLDSNKEGIHYHAVFKWVFRSLGWLVGAREG